MSIDLAVLLLIKVWLIDGLISRTKAIVSKSSPKKEKKGKKKKGFALLKGILVFLIHLNLIASTRLIGFYIVEYFIG